MLPLTHNDYFTTNGHGKDWTVQLKSITTNSSSWYEESIRAAQIINDISDSPLTLLFSGGLDSEYMLNIFKHAGVDFKVAIISYGDYNIHDNRYAFKYCEAHSIEPIVVDIDIAKFINSGKIFEVANEAKCCAYQIPSIMYGVSKLDGTVIMANGEPYVKNFNGDWRWEETERVNSYMNWFKAKGINGTPDFLRYTPEMTLSFLMEPRVIQLVNNEHPGKLSTRTSKHLIFSQKMELEKRSKYTGWEEIENTSFMSEITTEFNLLKTKYNGVFELGYNDLVEVLSKY